MVALDEATPTSAPTFQRARRTASPVGVGRRSAPRPTRDVLRARGRHQPVDEGPRHALGHRGRRRRSSTRSRTGDRVARRTASAARCRRCSRSPTTRARSTSAVDGLAIDAVQGTALHDAVVAGARGAGLRGPDAPARDDRAHRRRRHHVGAPPRRSRRTPPPTSRSTVYTIGIASDDFQPGDLQAARGRHRRHVRRGHAEGAGARSTAHVARRPRAHLRAELRLVALRQASPCRSTRGERRHRAARTTPAARR